MIRFGQKNKSEYKLYTTTTSFVCMTMINTVLQNPAMVH